MKVLSVEQIREADAYTIEHEPIPSIDLMERAAKQCFNWIITHTDKKKQFQIVCGTGNNGGDGLVIARLLINDGYKVELALVHYASKLSTDCEANLKSCESIEGIKIHHIREEKEIPTFDSNAVIIDALFGSGLSRPVSGIAGIVIDHLNEANAIVISIDMPSGLFADYSTDKKKGAIVEADYTLSFQFPKLAFLMAQNDRFVGDWHILSIGLHPDFINNTNTQNYFMTSDDIKSLIKPRTKFSHKGNYGHACLISGSYGKTGAAILASRSAMRTGLGLLTTHIPQKGYEIMQSSSPEAMVSVDPSEKFITTIPDLSKYNAIGIGPGIGTEPETATALKTLIQSSRVPLLLDADALNILSENKTWFAFLPKGSILTPHPGEFERMVGKWSDDFEKIQMQRNFSTKYGVHVVLKGAHTSISSPNGNVYFNSTGNPGMATAGSGDVLSGMILSLMAQSYPPSQAAVLGTHLHGLAGDMASDQKSIQALIASDIIDHIADAFIHYEKII
ncbi:MAG: NAD(P)H-hydrate dehydratase [Bacteroidales bacterium]|nr:NAD(P)H-hydrate dehydratase [Bacteroidales bacterium]